MSDTCRSDAAYVLGALSPADRYAYEEHLRACSDCQASVQRIAGLPGLLALTTAAEIEDLVHRSRRPCCPGLIARAESAKRRRTWVSGGLIAAALVAVLALGGVLISREAEEVYPTGPAASAEAPPTSPSSGASSSPSSSPAAAQPMTQLMPGPMTASLEIADKKWGTAITVICQYDMEVDPTIAYNLAIVETDGQLDPAGTWLAVPGATSRVTTATAVHQDRIAAYEVRLPDGRTILRLTR